MLSVAILSSLLIGFLLGFVSYHATRVGVHEWRKLEK
ncbi:MAG: hypothetical protein PWR19_2153 [Carnobacterium sp.]|nr:hypothetical protein [Carnobacterium sp.]